MMMLKKILALLLCLTLTGCSSLLSPVKSEPSQIYLINTKPCPRVIRPDHVATILVAVPETNPVYDTTEMAYSLCPHQISYFSKNGWAATPAQMIHPLIVQTLQETKHFHAVLTPAFMGRTHYVLTTQILKLHQDFCHRPSVVYFVLHAQLWNAETNHVIATREFCDSEVAPCDNPYGGVLATNTVVCRVLRQLSEFVTRNT